MKEVQKKAAIANARLRELEKANLTMASAYQHWSRNGARDFGNVSGNSFQSYQSEYWRINNFLNAATSTVSGALETLSQMQSNTGYKADTYEKYRDFFGLADKISDYYKMMGDTAKSLDYQMIWEQINNAVQHGMDIKNVQGVKDIMDLLDIADAIEREKQIVASTPNNVAVASSRGGVVGKIGKMLQAGINQLKSIFGKMFKG